MLTPALGCWRKKMKKEFAILCFLPIIFLSCQKKQSKNQTFTNNDQKSISKDVIDNNETKTEKGLSDKWIIDLSIYNDVPEDSFISSISLHLNKDNYSLGYHFQGGPFAYGKYTIEDNKVFLNYPENIKYESDTYTYLLNKIFPNKENQVFAYDSNYKSLAYSGCLRNENSIFADINNPSPVNEEYDFEGIKVIKLETFNAYSKETMKLRTSPSTTSEVGKFSYEICEYSWIKEKYNVCEDKDSLVPYLLAGKICKVDLKTVAEEEIDGINAPWYRIGIWGGPEDRGHYFWIWGGYLEKWPEEENRKEVDDLFVKEALRLNVVKKAE